MSRSVKHILVTGIAAKKVKQHLTLIAKPLEMIVTTAFNFEEQLEYREY